jgi:hypothetical protein
MWVLLATGSTKLSIRLRTILYKKVTVTLYITYIPIENEEKKNGTGHDPVRPIKDSAPVYMYSQV